MTTVYVLIEEMGYDGSILLGVYRTEIAAKQSADEYATRWPEYRARFSITTVLLNSAADDALCKIEHP